MRFNAHTHFPAHDTGETGIVGIFFTQNPEPEAPYRSFGLHPRYLPDANLSPALAWLNDRLPGAVAVGEAGLDKLCDTPWERQVEAFDHCIEAATQHHLPLIIHCVRAYDEVLAQLKKHQFNQPVIFHGFDKHPNTARQLLAAGCYLSFGSALFRENSHAAEALRVCPERRYFLETDMGAVALIEVYKRAANLRGVRKKELEAALWKLGKEVFLGLGH
ncbi:MAG: TatD family hydrolase [Saprospiraceae bacterium]|nr:TatD family hydrolase [Saprospiraceae bacterium]